MKERDDFAGFINLSPKGWDKVIDAAREYVPVGVRRSSARSKVSASAPIEKRAMLRKDSDDESV